MITEQQIDALYNIYRAHPRVVTDSRGVVPGSLFIALKGASFDGNRFAGAALDAGAVCAVIDDADVADEYAASHPGADISSLFFPVDDSLEALQVLAARHRRTLGIPILAITGTNGKTTTKELIAAVMSRKYNVYATQGNLNNHIGVPLTLLAMTEETEFGVVEMGASAQGEIALLAGIAAPGLGLITNIGRAHLEGFGGEEGVRNGKGELYDYLAATGGTAIVRRDDPVLAEMASERSGLKVEYYDLHSANGIDSHLAGDYNRANIAAAAAVGRLFGISNDDIKAAIHDYVPSNNRSQFIDTGQNTVLADCYNANPSSMAAAIENFAAKNDRAKGEGAMKKTVILGDMMELGPWAEAEHEKIAALALSGGFDLTVLTGANFSAAVRRLTGGNKPERVVVLPDTEALKAYLDVATIRDNIILVKGSRSMKLEEVIGLL